MVRATPKIFIFLDRDGVINKDSSEYIKNRSEFHFLPRTLEAIKLLTQNDFSCIIISNQSMINRKISTLENLMDMHIYMLSEIQSHGGHIQDFFFCPHRPDEYCMCRKPKPGMIVKAASIHSIDISQSIMIGDSLKDIQCAINAGCRHAILVRTGNGIKTETVLADNALKASFIANDLLDATRWILNSFKINVR
ncbi:MAG: D-glycero-beta-D-manno-heptose 1,7-bisphosphate 7-phosphatase [Candidatus Magnetomorum sp.]|nr:D-glycero-beta-D-manno-heptose 1,7-bisphosphate 7-phosphatase [Candidatus Magnetomorum sp.]